MDRESTRPKSIRDTLLENASSHGRQEERSESVLREIKEPRRLLQIVNSELLKYFHVTRRDNDDLERLVVYGKLEGTRLRGPEKMV